MFDSKGNVIGGGGSASEYKYFGAARELPGVREMLAEREKERAKQYRRWRSGGREQRGEDGEGSARKVRHLTPEYFGFAGPDDDDDFEEALREEEDRYEAAAVEAAQREWDAAHTGGNDEGWHEDDDGTYDEKLQRAVEFAERV